MWFLKTLMCLFPPVCRWPAKLVEFMYRHQNRHYDDLCMHYPCSLNIRGCFPRIIAVRTPGQRMKGLFSHAKTESKRRHITKQGYYCLWVLDPQHFLHLWMTQSTSNIYKYRSRVGTLQPIDFQLVFLCWPQTVSNEPKYLKRKDCNYKISLTWSVKSTS